MKPKVDKTIRKKQDKKTHQSISPFEGYLFPFFVFFFAIILYGNTVNHDFALDDSMVTRGNESVLKGFDGIPVIFTRGSLYGFNKANDGAYRPISLFTLAVETGLYGSKPGVHHFFNILYYALACVVLFLLLRRLFPKHHIWIPFVITLLFTAHPIHTEAVANIKSRDEVLMLLFLLLSLWKLFQFCDTNKKLHLILAVIFYFISLLTKEQSITFLALIPLTLYFFREIPFRKILIISVPFFVVAGLYLLLRWSVLDTMTFSDTLTQADNTILGAPNFQGRVATIIFILGKYILLLLFPYPLSWDYSYSQIPIVSFSNPWAIVSMLVYVALFVFAILKLRSKNIFSYSFLYFIIIMSIVSNVFIIIASTLGERFLLTPSVFFCVSLFFIIQKLTRTDLSKPLFKSSMSFLGIMAVILVLYSFKTIDRNKDWKNNMTLFAQGVESSPNSARAHAAYAFTCKEAALQIQDAAEKARYFEIARVHFTKSLEIFPGYYYSLYNFGVMNYEMGNPDAAEELYLEAIKQKPNDLSVLNNLSIIYIQKEQYDEAMKYMLRKLDLTPNDVPLIGNIGAIYQRKSLYNEAIKYDEMALKIDPVNELVINNLIDVYKATGDTAKLNYYLNLKNKRASSPQ